MAIHGVDEDDFLKKSTQKDLYENLKSSARVICF